MRRGQNRAEGMTRYGGDKTARGQRKTFRRRRYLRRERSKARTQVTSAARQQGAAGKKRRGGREKLSAEGEIYSRKRSKARTRVTAGAHPQGAAGTKPRGGREKLSAEGGICGGKGAKRGHESPQRRASKARQKMHERIKKNRHQSATNCKPKHKKKTRNISDPFFAIRAACAETFGTGAPLRYFRFYAGFSSRPVGKPRRRSVRAPPLLRDFYSLPSGYSEKYSVGEPNLRFLTPL